MGKIINPSTTEKPLTKIGHFNLSCWALLSTLPSKKLFISKGLISKFICISSALYSWFLYLIEISSIIPPTIAVFRIVIGITAKLFLSKWVYIHLSFEILTFKFGWVVLYVNIQVIAVASAEITAPIEAIKAIIVGVSIKTPSLVFSNDSKYFTKNQ